MCAAIDLSTTCVCAALIQARFGHDAGPVDVWSGSERLVFIASWISTCTPKRLKMRTPNTASGALWTPPEQARPPHSGGPVLGTVGEMDSRSARHSNAVLRSASNPGHAGSPALPTLGCSQMDRRDRAVRRLRLRHPGIQLRTRGSAQERHRLGLSGVESQSMPKR